MGSSPSPGEDCLVGGAITILKNDEVKVNGFGMTSHIYEMEHNIAMFETTNQLCISMPWLTQTASL